MSIQTIPVFLPTPVETYTIVSRKGFSGSAVVDGLYKADDSANPLSSVLTTGISGLCDRNYKSPVSVSSNNYSIGIDLGRTMNVYGLSLFDVDDGTVKGGISWSGSHAGIQVYKSSNNSTWTLVERYYPVERRPWSGSVNRIDLQFADGLSTSDALQSARYFKLYAFSGSLWSSIGVSLKPTEIQAQIQPGSEISAFSGSKVTPVSVTIVPNYSLGIPVVQSQRVIPNSNNQRTSTSQA